MDSATSPSASCRMTRGRRHTAKMESLGLEKPTKRESGVIGAFLLMPGTLFFVDSSIKY